MSIIERRVRRLEVERGVSAGGRCAVCDDGVRPSGLVFRVEGGEQPDQTMPVCTGCGRCNPLVFDIVIADPPAEAAAA